MIVRKLKIANFRGIEQLEWAIPADKKLICIIGAGDSGKTTVLDALDWLLGDRWNLPISFADFKDESKPIVVTAALSQIPNELLSIGFCGLCLRGISEDGDIASEPFDGFEQCLVVELSIGIDFEPTWSIICPDGSPIPFKASIRRKLGVSKLDERVDTHLRWSRNSALGRVSRGTDGAEAALRDATQAARNALNELSVPADFVSVLDDIRASAQALGAADYSDMTPGLDVSRGDGYGSLALYSGSVPVHRYGLGTRRLTSLAIQKLGASDKSTLLIDEAESGLEPHRVIGLIETLRSDGDISQAFLTTHSSNAVESCSAAEIAILANRSGAARCSFVPEELEGLHRSNPSPFLARSIIVVEGQTEEGLYRAFAERHDDASRAQGDPTLAARGVCLCQGNGGSSAVSKAMGFASLGYKVALLVDADDSDTNDKLESARKSGVRIFTWPNGWSTESAIFDALEKEQISQLLVFIVDKEIVSRERVNSDFSNNGLGTFNPSSPEACWLGRPEEDVRERLVASASKRKGWFKSVPASIELGKWLIDTVARSDRFYQSDLYTIYHELLSTFPRED
mgnify:CR=1 FL=1